MLLLLMVALSVIAGSAGPSRAEMEYEVNFLLGAKALDESDWEPLEEQAAFAVCTTFGKVDWPVMIALDLVGSADATEVAGIDLEAGTTEFNAGIRKIWKKKNVRPFLGGGLSFLTGKFEVEGLSVDDDGVGAWIDGGVFWRLGRRFNIGIEARVSRGEITFGPFDVEAGGEQVGLILGFGSPSD
jgi:hypothetical protein